MTVFCFYMPSSVQIELELDICSIADLDKLMSCQRFLRGRHTGPDSDGQFAEVLLATSRIHFVVERGTS